MIYFLQINLNRSPLARNLMYAKAATDGIHVMLTSEPPRGPPDNGRRFTSPDGNCAIVLNRTADLVAEEHGSAPGHVWIRTGTMVVFSCYMSPNSNLPTFELELSYLERAIRQIPAEMGVVIGGDFNSKSYAWGSATEDVRGQQLCELMIELGFVPTNVGNSPTFQRSNSESVIDVTFNRHTSRAITDWRVTDEYTGSDHNYISFSYDHDRRLPTPDQGITDNVHPRKGWAYRKMNKDALNRFLGEHTMAPLRHHTPAEQAATSLSEYLTAACNACMPPRPPESNRRKPVYWWSDEIAELRGKALRAKRLYIRARRRTPVLPEALTLDFRATRSALKTAIRAAQERSWRQLCNEVEQDPWGLPYRLVMKKLNTNPPGVEARGREEIIADYLFPTYPVIDWDTIPLETSTDEEETLEEFTAEELASAARKLPSGKASGPDGIPNEVLAVVAKVRPQTLLAAFNVCLRQATFPAAWKEARLVLLHKGQGKPTDDPASFRPLSMLNTAGKTLERLILNRINGFLETSGDPLSPRQFGFRACRSTEDAIGAALAVAKKAAAGASQKRDLCVMVCLDVRNAFNSAPWHLIDNALRRKKVPLSLVRLIRSYLHDRTLIVTPNTKRPVTCGVPQGSVIGPVLWNLYYDALLTIPLPVGVEIIAYADDIAILATAHTGPLLEQALNPALQSVHQWMTENGLEVAPHKTEALLLSKKWAYTAPKLILAGHDIVLQKSVKYLGVTLDQRLTFTPHVMRITKSAAEAARAVGRLLVNTGGPSTKKRLLLSSVVSSKLLYASPVWAEQAFKTARNRDKTKSVQRLSALRIIRAYRTVSSDAALVLAKILPIDILAAERVRVRTRCSEPGPTEPTAIKREERSRSLRIWQERWTTSTKGEWTRRLLPDLVRWYNSTVTPSYHVTQALSGHGCFQAYLVKRNRAVSATCIYCAYPRDDAEHTLFQCPRWDSSRLRMGQFLGGRNPTADDVTDLLCGPQLPVDLEPQTTVRLIAAAERARTAFIETVTAIFTQKEDDERQLQKHIYPRRV